MRVRAPFALVPIFLMVALLVTAGSARADVTNPKHYFWVPNQQPNLSAMTNDLIYHGGNAGSGAIGVETKPAVYLVFWGPQWQSGFTDTDANGVTYSSSSLINYVQSFFGNVGGSSWANVPTQYCKNIPAGSTSCKGYKGVPHVGNPAGQLKGTWVDPSPVPSDIVALGFSENLVDDPIAAEAASAVQHFGWDSNATYIIQTQPETVATGQPVYCGYHTQTTTVDGLGNPERFQYAFIPYLNASWPVLGKTACGMNYVNSTSDTFGHGVWDGYSIVEGHEYAEAETDPDNFASIQDGWNDDQTNENGDKCAWYHTQNVTVGGGYYFAVQPTWSNAAFDAGQDGCQVSYSG